MLEGGAIVLFPKKEGRGLVVRFIVGGLEFDGFEAQAESLAAIGLVLSGGLHFESAEIEVRARQARIVNNGGEKGFAGGVPVALFDFDDAEQVFNAAVVRPFAGGFCDERPRSRGVAALNFFLNSEKSLVVGGGCGAGLRGTGSDEKSEGRKRPDEARDWASEAAGPP